MNKIKIAAALLLLSSTSFAIDGSLTGSEITVTYQEPTTNKNGSALTDLAKTTIYAKSNGTTDKIKDVNATSATGGGTITESFIVAVGPDQEADVEVWATATDVVGNESDKSASITVRVDHLAPASPQ